MNRSRILAVTSAVLVAAVLLGRAVTVHSVGSRPLIYRVLAAGNDLDTVEGAAVPGRLVELWYKQRNFIEGDAVAPEAFSWCAWKNQGTAVHLASAQANDAGVFRFVGLRASNTVNLFPASANEDGCKGGIMTQLLVRACDAPGVNCTAFDPPTLHWLNVQRRSGVVGTASGSVSRAERAAIAVADGPNDGPEWSSVTDVDQNFLDTLRAGFTPGQRLTWKCGTGGTANCPSIVIHDATTITGPDPEFGYLLGTIQGHRPGGSIFAAAAVKRPEDTLGFQVNVNVRLRGGFDLNLGCDRAMPFDFLPF
jgi:hypothetical protein